MKKFFFTNFFGLIFCITIFCSGKNYESIVPEKIEKKTITGLASDLPRLSVTYNLNLVNSSFGCAKLKITDSNGIIYNGSAAHSSTVNDTFSSSDSVVTVQITTASAFTGVSCYYSNGSNVRIGGGDYSGSYTKTEQITLPADGTLKVRVIFYNPCPFPDEPGCPVPPSTPYSCF